MLSSALIGYFTVPLISIKETQGEKYIFKYFLSQLYRRVNILYIKHGHQGAVINTRGIETAFEWSVNRVIVSGSKVVFRCTNSVYIMEHQYLPHIWQDKTLVSAAQDL